MKTISMNDKLWKRLNILSQYFDMNVDNTIEKLIDDSYDRNIKLNVKLSEDEILRILDMRVDQ